MRPGRELARLAVVALPVLLAAGGCGPAASGSGAGPPSAASGVSATVSAPAPGATTEGRPASAQLGVAVDARLLDVLPTEIDGVALEADPTTAAQIAADPGLAISATAIAVALAIDPGTSSGGDLAVVSVVRLRPGVFSDTWFASWRATYDAAACVVAGGVEGQPAMVDIGGRTAFVARCAGDARTYHVHLADPTIVVSVTAVGRRDFGELVVAGLSE